MYQEHDELLSALHLACAMAVYTIKDIHKESEGETLCSDDLEDLHMCLDILKDSYAVKELHMAYLEEHESAKCASKE